MRHQSPLRSPSPGAPVFNPSFAVACAGGASLKAGGAVTAGRLYCGPTMQPQSSRATLPTEIGRNRFILLLRLTGSLAHFVLLFSNGNPLPFAQQVAGIGDQILTPIQAS